MLKSERRRRLLLLLDNSELDIAESERDDEDGESELFSEYFIDLDSSILGSSSSSFRFGATKSIRFLLFAVVFGVGVVSG